MNQKPARRFGRFTFLWLLVVVCGLAVVVCFDDCVMTFQRSHFIQLQWHFHPPTTAS